MPEIYDLDIVDANNTGRWPEGMVGGAINNAGRADEGLLARWYKDTDGSLVASGAANAFAVTQNRDAPSLGNNHTLVFTANHSITGPATLDLNGHGAKALVRFNGDALVQGDIISGQPVAVIFKTAIDSWFVMSALAASTGNMFADFDENASPGTPAANDARLYAKDTGGNTELRWRDNAAADFNLRAATQSQMEAASADNIVQVNRQHFHPGHPKAWGRATEAGALVSGSYNITSVVRNSTGVYTVTLANAMADTNYLVLATSVTAGFGISANVDITSTTVFVVRTGSDGALDRAFGFAVFGDMPT